MPFSRYRSSMAQPVTSLPLLQSSSSLRSCTRESLYFRAATLPAVPKTLPNLRQRRSRISLESTNGRVGLHVSFIVKTHFRHAPESHACLSEVGKDSAAVLCLPTTFRISLHPLHQTRTPVRRHRSSTPLHHFTCIRFSVVYPC